MVKEEDVDEVRRSARKIGTRNDKFSKLPHPSLICLISIPPLSFVAQVQVHVQVQGTGYRIQGKGHRAQV